MISVDAAMPSGSCAAVTGVFNVAAACLVTSCRCGFTTTFGHCSDAVDRRPTSFTVRSTVLLCCLQVCVLTYIMRGANSSDHK